MKVKTLQGLSAEEQNRGQQKQQERDAERNPRRRALPDRNDRSPERTATHQNNETGARKIQNDRRNENTECHEPEEPAFSAVTKVVLSARQQHNRCDAKKIGSLISVRERPEAALINPKRKSRVRQVECDAYPSQGHYDSLCPFLRASTQETSQHGQKSNGAVAQPLRRRNAAPNPFGVAALGLRLGISH